MTESLKAKLVSEVKTPASEMNMPKERTEIARKGGKARAAALSPAKRTEIARKASNTRWGKKPSQRKTITQEVFENALEKLERAQLLVRAMEFVQRVIQEAAGTYHRYDVGKVLEARSVVYQLELDQWRNLFLLSGTIQLTPKLHAELKRRALKRFFTKDRHIADHLGQDFGLPAQWLTGDEEALRAEFAKSAKEVGLDPQDYLR